MWWGYSEALDLQDEVKAAKETRKTQNVDEIVSEELNVLLIGNGDGRHILKTLSKAYKHPRKQVNFYVVEPTLELYARQMLFFAIALEPPDELGLLEKTRAFMELYGNTLLRPTTAAYLSRKAAQLVAVVTTLGSTAPMMHVDKLKYRERDSLEHVFRFWKNCAGVFDIITLWDERVRKSLGVRYDSRGGAFDWDYHMRLHPLGGAMINKREYVQFRQCGVSFAWLETEFSKPNATLASGVLKFGDKMIHHGYIGDTTMGPYATYGLDCEDDDMLKSTQGVYLKRATDITERNVMRMMYEIEKKEGYVHRKTDFDEENLGVVITEICDNIDDLNVDVGDDETIRSQREDTELKTMDVAPVSVRFLPTSSLREMEKLSAKYSDLFDVISVAQYMDGCITEELLKLGKDKSLLLVEGKLFVMGLRGDDLVKRGEELNEKMKGLGIKCTRLNEFDPKKNTIARYIVEHST